MLGLDCEAGAQFVASVMATAKRNMIINIKALVIAI